MKKVYYGNIAGKVIHEEDYCDITGGYWSRVICSHYNKINVGCNSVIVAATHCDITVSSNSHLELGDKNIIRPNLAGSGGEGIRISVGRRGAITIFDGTYIHDNGWFFKVIKKSKSKLYEVFECFLEEKYYLIEFGERNYFFGKTIKDAKENFIYGRHIIDKNFIQKIKEKKLLTKRELIADIMSKLTSLEKVTLSKYIEKTEKLGRLPKLMTREFFIQKIVVANELTQNHYLLQYNRDKLGAN
jgi:hypothetical protein